MWCGLWQKRAKYTETTTAIAFEQHGFFEQAQNAYEMVSLESSLLFLSYCKLVKNKYQRSSLAPGCLVLWSGQTTP